MGAARVVGWVGLPRYQALMDGAGPHRRVATSIPTYVAALLMLIAANLTAGDVSLAAWVPHLVMIVGAGWALAATIRTGRLLDQGGRPHPGLVLIASTMIWWAVAAARMGAPIWSAISLLGGLVMILAIAAFVAAERVSMRPALLGGRLLLSIGALLFGSGILVAALGQLPPRSTAAAIELLGLLTLSLASMGLALAEARLVYRLIGYGAAVRFPRR